MKRDELIDLVLSNMPIGYIILKKEQKGEHLDYFIEDVNKSFQKVTNIKTEDLKGRYLSEAMKYVLDNSFDWIKFADTIVKTPEASYTKHNIETATKKYKVYVYKGGEYLIGLFDDVTSDIKMENRMKELYSDLVTKNEKLYIKTITDDLTGLHSREYIIQTMQRIGERIQRYGGVATIGILDIDHFKRVNDTLGHLAGDEVLKCLSVIMRTQLRATDYLGRYGGEEFIIVFDSSRISEVMNVCERLREDIESHVFRYGEEEISITVSIGLAEYSSQNISDLLVEADKKMYEAKRKGRNQVCI